jgi:signal transduction histidine kinase
MAVAIDIQQQAPVSRFTRLTLLWIVSAIFLAGISASILFVKILMERDQQLVAGFISSAINQTISNQKFSKKNNNKYVALFSKLQLYYQVEKIIFYDTNGVAVWINQGNVTDIKTESNNYLKKPLQGLIQIRYSSSDKIVSSHSKKDNKYIFPWLPDLLIPIRGESNEVTGVARITRVPELLIEELVFGLFILWGILIISGSVYYIFFYRLFMRTSNELLVCEYDLEKSRRLAEIGECVSMIVHDTRNLMGSIQFILERMRDDKISKERRSELIDGAKRPLQMSFAMMEDMLSFVSGKQPPLTCYKHKLKQLITEGQDMLMAMLESSGHQLKIDIQDDLIIYWDSQKLLHILINLLRNAAESMTEPGIVTIIAAREKGGVRMQVKDTGNGIPEKLLANLFEPFMSEPGKTRPGLGLAIIRDLVRRHGGDVTAKNWEQGAEFDLYFPDCPVE